MIVIFYYQGIASNGQESKSLQLLAMIKYSLDVDLCVVRFRNVERAEMNITKHHRN